MSEILEIREQVVKFLLERHSQEKEAGREFYFTVEYTNYDDFPYSLESEFVNKLPLKISVYGKWDQSPIAYLLIDSRSRTFMVFQFNEGYTPVEYEVVTQLNFYILNNSPKGIQYLQGGPISLNSFVYTSEIKIQGGVIDKIAYFLDTIKPGIDDRIKLLRKDAKYSYYFLNRQQFEDYLKTEPFYSPPVIIVKKNLALKSLRVQNFKGINQLTIDDLPAAAQWIILTGENGFGKTSVLQAIAAGLYGNKDESGAELVTDSSFIGVEYYADGEVIETNSRTPRLDASPLKLVNELATYGSSRLQVSASVTKEMIEQQAPTTYHLFNTDGFLLNVEQYLKDSFYTDKSTFDQIVNLFKKLLPTLLNIDIVLKNKIPEVRYFEKDEDDKPLSNGLLFNELASGFKNIIAMIGDLIYRLSIKQNIDNFSELEGIVIIDELELHLHPKYQKLLPEVLSKNFPKIQFIASTHSPIPLLGVPKETVLLHVTRSDDKGIEVERLDVDFSVLTPNAILSSPIFGFKDLIPGSKEDDQMIQPEDTYEEVTENRQLRSQINEFLSPENQQELLKLIKEK